MFSEISQIEIIKSIKIFLKKPSKLDVFISFCIDEYFSFNAERWYTEEEAVSIC